MAKKSRPSSQNSTPVGTPTKKAKPKNKSKVVPKKAPSLTSVPRERILNSIQQLRKLESSNKKTESRNLLDDEDELDGLTQLVVVNNTSFTGANKNFKLKLATIKHSLYKAWNESNETSIKDFKILLILKDSDVNKISVDDLVIKDQNASVQIEIVCGKTLKTNYKAFERRRAFVSEFSLILADDNIITTLPKLLGGKAYSKLETTPIGIRTYANKQFSAKTLINSLNKVYSSKLPVKLPRGTTASVHLGNLKWFKDEEMVDNVELILKDFIDNYKIRSVFIKCNSSPVLPLYYNQNVLDEIAKESKAVREPLKEDHLVEIDGVRVQLSNFDKALMEIANPDDLKDVFAKNINAAKRKAPEDQEVELEIVKKAKN